MTDPFKEPNHGWHRKKRFELIKARGGQCECIGECGHWHDEKDPGPYLWVGRGPRCISVNDLEFAHVKPTELKGKSRGYNERVLDILKHPDAYKLLCRACHQKLDSEQASVH